MLGDGDVTPTVLSFVKDDDVDSNHLNFRTCVKFVELDEFLSITMFGLNENCLNNITY